MELYRVDNRLVHGQVLEAWVPRVGAQAILVVDDTASDDPFQKCVLEAMGQGVLHICVSDSRSAAESLKNEMKGKNVIVLFKSVGQAVAAYNAGLRFEKLNLGNIHPAPGSKPLTPSVNLTGEDEVLLDTLIKAGVKIDARAVPCEAGSEVSGFCARDGD